MSTTLAEHNLLTVIARAEAALRAVTTNGSNTAIGAIAAVHLAKIIEAKHKYDESGTNLRDPDYSRSGIFVHHNCAYCDDGKKPCRQTHPNQCDYPHARND